MIRHRFEYRAPDAMDAALGLLAERGADVAVMAGGTWLVPNMTRGAEQPPVVLDARRLALDGIAEDGDDVVLGALATYRQILSSGLVRSAAPMLSYMAAGITGGPAVVGQATAGGAACYGNVSSDVPGCLVGLGARLALRSRQGTRLVGADAFFRGPFLTDRQPDEILAAIRVPKTRPGSMAGYHKLKFSAGSWPIVTASCTARPGGGAALALRVAVGGASATPVLWHGECAADASRDELAQLAEAVAELVVDEWSDEFAGPGYRRQATPGVVLKAVLKAVGPR